VNGATNKALVAAIMEAINAFVEENDSSGDEVINSLLSALFVAIGHVYKTPDDRKHVADVLERAIPRVTAGLEEFLETQRDVYVSGTTN
jgi:hypothetical protein